GVDATRTLPPIDQRRTRPSDPEQGDHGLTVQYFANRELQGEPVAVEHAQSPRLTWLGDDAAPGARAGEFSVRMTGTFVADIAGEHQFSLVTGGDGGRVLLGGETILDN